MRTCLTSLIALSLCTSPAFAQGKVVLDTWDAAYFGDGRAGYVHTVASEFDLDGKKFIETSVELRLTVKRFNDTVQMIMDTGTVETPDGKVVGTVMRHFLGKELKHQIDGVVVGKQIELTHNGKTKLNPAPWNPAVIGLYKQQTLYKDRNVKPGDKITYFTFEPSINLVIKVQLEVKGYEEVQLKGAKQKTKLLLAEHVPDKIETKGDKVQLPTIRVWLDEKLEPVKSQSEISGWARITLQRTKKALATAAVPFAELVDISTSQRAVLKNRILDAHNTTAAVYRITIRDDKDVATAFSRDSRQQVKNVKGNTFELHVKGSGSNGEPAEKEPAAEFLQSSYFINSADAKVKELARQAVGAETDSLKKALRIERWVHGHMEFVSDDALAPADHVARTLKGDCTEYAMLTAAMCRAEGVPSRTAIGLVYAEEKKAPFFAFHMWTEVWTKGRWVPIDATLLPGQHVAAAHLKVTDHSWHEERTMTPLFPIIRVVGKLNIEVLSAENR